MSLTPLLTPTAFVKDEGPATKLLRPLDTRPKSSWQDLGWPKVRGYEILSVIGSGGMGIVYKARHRELQRTVALKTLRGAAVADVEIRDRLQAEATAVAQLQHPNIIQVFEVGMSDPLPGEFWPNPFIALEYVEGGSLAERTEKPQPPRSAAALVIKLAHAVHFAHQLGIIHRDLKPANVLVTPEGEPKIADFGIAKQLGTECAGAGRFVTQAGAIVGTPEYMAPEQATGAAPTPAIDVYALGVILYELLTGRVPIQAASPVETMGLIRHQEPVSPRRLQPGLPRDLETICLKCLEKDAARRYDCAQALADDLQRFLDDRPIQARPIRPVERATRWARRNPLVAALMAAVVLMGIAGFNGVLWKWREAQEHAAALEVATTEARELARSERWERYHANIAAAASALQVFNISSARRALDASPEEHRNWEWRHFHSRLDLARHVLAGSDDAVTDARVAQHGRRVFFFTESGASPVWDPMARALARSYPREMEIWRARFSADGRTMARVRPDHSIELTDVDTGQTRAILLGHQKPVHAVLFSADGARVVTASDDRTLRLWDPRTGALRRVLQSPRESFVSVAMRADGCRVIAFDRRHARVWDLDAGKQVNELNGEIQDLQDATFSPQGDRIVTVEGFPEATMRLWDAATGRLLGTQRGHANNITQTIFSTDGTRIATSSRDQTIGLWDGATGQPVAMLKGHLGWVNSAAFSPDGKRLVSASVDQTLRIWEAQTGQLLAVLYGHTGDVFAVSFTADSAGIVSASRDGTIRVWDAPSVEDRGILRGHTTFVYGASFHPDGQRVASASWDGTARIWDAATSGQLTSLPHPKQAFVTSVAFHPSGTILASRARDAVRLWDVESGREIHCWNVPSDYWRDTRVAFSPRGNLLASGCRHREIRIWDVASRAELGVLRGHQNEIRDVVFSPDARWLASAAEDNEIRIWDVAAHTPLHVLQGHTAGAYAVAFNAAGTLLASGATDGTVRLWDTSSWKLIAVLKHGTKVYSVAFTPDGTRLACGCADNSIRFWDTRTYQEVAELRGHKDYVHQIAFSKDGTRLVSASGDGTARIWDTIRHQERALSEQ